MANEKLLIQMEKQIKHKMFLIETKKVTVKDAKVGVLLNLLKDKDEVLYESLMNDYKNLLKKVA